MATKQRTLAEAISFEGKGLHTGLQVKMTVHPADDNHGITFRRVDLEGEPEVPALCEYVTDTSRGTTIEKGAAKVSTIEHIMSALWTLDVDNATIDINAPETPIMDGSAREYAARIAEVGTVEHDYNEIPKRNDNEPLKICWSGQHTPGKSLNLLIEALSINKNLNIELHIIGNGRETKKWQVLAKKLGLKNLIWYSWVQRSQALEIMKRSHLFVITSMSDLTSTVLLEALSYGLPVIAMDHCGFSNVINGKCGIKIPIKNKKQVVEDLQKAIEFYYNNETERFNASQNAKLRSNDYKWDNKLIILNEVYQKAIEDFKKKDTKQD